MARHRRSRIGWFRLRRGYQDLWLRYQELLKAHNDLQAEYDILLRPPDTMGRQTSWGRQNEDVLETAEIPVITSLPVPETAASGLDPDEAASLLARWSMSGSPSGAWERPDQGISG